MQQRCGWANGSQLLTEYHDKEWGVPVHDDRKHFEAIILDGMQAGLSWSTILNKRENFRIVFDGFDPVKVASYGGQKVMELLQDAGIIRNRLKILAAVKNAQAFLRVQEEYGSFDSYIWQFADGQTIQNAWGAMGEVPARTRESDAMSKDLQRRGFTFVGSTICYAYMQSTGMINDHVQGCFRWEEVKSGDHTPCM